MSWQLKFSWMRTNTGVDLAGPIENAMKSVDSTYKCNAYLCRGYQYEDNQDNVRAVKAGDVLTFHIDLVAGHHPGYAVSRACTMRDIEARGFAVMMLIYIPLTRMSPSST